MLDTVTNPEPKVSAQHARPHVTGDRPAELRQILNPDVNLCLWRRPVQPAITKELCSLRASHLPDVRCETSPASFDDDVSMLLTQQGLDPALFKHWRDDLRCLANLFFSVSGKRDVVLRLDAMDEDGCQRFHIDRTHLRLLCTYRGPGTEWLTNEQVDRDAQGNGAPNERIIRFGEPSRFEPFWVGILKGSAYPGNARRGLVHRSPPIAGSGQTRILFCLDSRA
ncbi:MAG: DUF1826 domain-containing protein [Myxococcota bacterium]